MKKHVFHYSVEFLDETGELRYADGTIEAEFDYWDSSHYKRIRSSLAKDYGCAEDKLVVRSFSNLSVRLP